MLNSCKWLGAIILDRADIEHFHHCKKTLSDSNAVNGERLKKQERLWKMKLKPNIWRWSSDSWLSEGMLLWVFLPLPLMGLVVSRKVQKMPIEESGPELWLHMSWAERAATVGPCVKCWEACDSCTCNSLRLGGVCLQGQWIDYVDAELDWL